MALWVSVPSISKVDPKETDVPETVAITATERVLSPLSVYVIITLLVSESLTAKAILPVSALSKTAAVPKLTDVPDMVATLAVP